MGGRAHAELMGIGTNVMVICSSAATHLSFSLVLQQSTWYNVLLSLYDMGGYSAIFLHCDLTKIS